MVSIDEARIILGSKGNTLTDKEIETMITWLRTLCEKVTTSLFETNLQS